MNQFDKILKAQQDRRDSIVQGFENQDIEKSLDENDIQKGGRPAVLGEVRVFGGREYVKTNDGWKFHGKGTGAKAQAHVASTKAHHEGGKKEDAKNEDGEKSLEDQLKTAQEGYLKSVQRGNPSKDLKNDISSLKRKIMIQKNKEHETKVEKKSTTKTTDEHRDKKKEISSSNKALSLLKNAKLTIGMESGYHGNTNIGVKSDEFHIRAKNRTGKYHEDELKKIHTALADYDHRIEGTNIYIKGFKKQ